MDAREYAHDLLRNLYNIAAIHAVICVIALLGLHISMLIQTWPLLFVCAGGLLPLPVVLVSFIMIAIIVGFVVMLVYRTSYQTVDEEYKSLLTVSP